MSITSRIAAGKRVHKGWLALGIILGLAGLVGGGILFSNGEQVPAMIFLVAGTVVLAITIGWAAAVARQWREIEVTETGFLTSDRTGDREFSDEDVVCLSLQHKRNFTNGEFKSMTRTLDLWTRDDASPRGMSLTRLINTYGVGQTDPLGDFIGRLAEHLHKRAKDDLATGEEVTGEGWSIERETFYVTDKSGSREILLGDVTSSAIVDKNVCVWVGDEESPSVKIPLEAANSYILQILLDEELAGRPEAESGDQPGLGRIMFERMSGTGVGYTVAYWFFMLLIVLFGLMAVAGATTGKTDMLITGVVVSLISVLFAWAIRHAAVSFRCHERGVSLVRKKSKKEMRYLDVGSFTWQATRMYVNGAYSGTQMKMVFVHDDPSANVNKISYSRNMNVIDDEIDNLRDHISGVIASKMLKKYEAGQSVQWTPYMTITPDGIEHRPSGFVGRKEAVMVPWDDIVNFDLNEGYFRIWRTADTKSSLNEAAAQDNFFPGFYLFCQIMEDRHRAAQPSAAGE